ERIAGAPKRLGGLLCAKLAAVPDDGRLGPSRSDISGQTFDALPSVRRERPLRIDVRTDSVAMVDEKKVQEGILVGGRRSVVRGRWSVVGGRWLDDKDSRLAARPVRAAARLAAVQSRADDVG